MGEIIKDNWFVLVVAIVIICFISFFIYDSNKYNVDKKTADGKDVVASVANKNITADDLYDTLSKDDGALLFNMYRNAVVSQSVKTTDDLKEKAKELENTIKSTAQQQSTDYETLLTNELASYGYTSADELNEYCLMSVKEKEMNKRYVDKHFDELKTALDEKKPRTISVIAIAVVNPGSLTEAEQSKKDSIDKALQSQSFGKTASQFSEDSNAGQKGLYGYIDQDDATSSNSSLDANVLNAALELKKDETSEWITVSDENTGANYLYLVHVNETSVDAIHSSKNDTIQDQLLYAILNNNKNLDVTILETNAKKLKIKFNDKDTESKVNAYIESLKEGDETE